MKELKSIFASIPESYRNTILIITGAIVVVIIGVSLMTTAVTNLFLGVLAFGGVGVTSFLGLKIFPFGSQFLENRILIKRKKEAAENPIEQLENLYASEREKLNKKRNHLMELENKIQELEKVIKAEAEKNPSLDLSTMEKVLAEMKKNYKKLVGEFKISVQQLDVFKLKIDQGKLNYAFSIASREIVAGMAEDNRESTIQDILASEAMQKVGSVSFFNGNLKGPESFIQSVAGDFGNKK